MNIAPIRNYYLHMYYVYEAKNFFFHSQKLFPKKRIENVKDKL